MHQVVQVRGKRARVTAVPRARAGSASFKEDAVLGET